MGKIKDLTGQIFGELIVIEDSKIRKNRQVVWKCKCSCGKITYVTGSSLRNGHTTSCGHKKYESKNTDNLIGQHFGKLTVIEEAGRTNNRQVIWNCKCQCGNYRKAIGYELKSGKVNACFDCTKQNLKYKIPTFQKIKNHKFGLLTALTPLNERDAAGHILWNCKCDCGNYIKVSSNSLLTNNTNSCGCLSTSKGQLQIIKLLKQNNILFSSECSFSTCLSPKQSKLFFDFSIIENNNIVRLIEYDGIQHYQSVEYFGGQKQLQYQKECDKIKNQWCKDNNIPLIRIPYTVKNITIDDIMGDKYLVK